MKVEEIVNECTIVYVDENDNILEEGSVRQWKRTGKTLVKKYRCTSGKKKGKLVSSPNACGQRKDPKRVRLGRKVMRMKKGVIGRKAKIAKKTSISKMLTRLNAKLMGKR